MLDLQISQIISDWNGLNDIRCSDIDNINNLLINLDSFDELSEINPRDLLELFLDLIGPTIIEISLEILLRFLANIDPFFVYRTTYEITKWASFFLITIISGNDIADSFDKLGLYELLITDDIVVAILGLLQAITGYSSYLYASTDYERAISEYYGEGGLFTFFQSIFEGLYETYLYKKYLPNMIFPEDARKIAEKNSDKMSAILECFIETINLLRNYYDFIEYGYLDTIIWLIIDGVYTYTDAIFPLLKEARLALKWVIVFHIGSIVALFIKTLNNKPIQEL